MCAFLKRFFKYVEHQSRCLVKANLPRNNFTCVSINDRCKVYLFAMEWRFGEITYPDAVWRNGTRALYRVHSTGTCSALVVRPKRALYAAC